ncbi:MAG: class III poly(R)-hydroxyalkanoic acid synthase subunit PhaC [Gammaproteobacteria bacterium]
MSRVTFTLDDLRGELADFGRQSESARRRLAAWRDEAPTHARRESVFHRGKLRLFHYVSARSSDRRRPLLVVYALVNRPYMADLLPETSLLGDLVARGIDLYLVDWGYPDATDRGRGLADYVDGDLDACVEYVQRTRQVERVDLLGICQGGTLALCYAALNPGKVARLITTVTPVDFQTPTDLLSHLVRSVDIDALVNAYGNVPGEFLNAIFLAQKPLQLSAQKYVDFVANADNDASSELFLAMEKWIFDSPALAGEAFRQFVKGCYQRNGLVNGSLRIGDRLVAPSRVRHRVLNVYARDDHLVPPAASKALRTIIASDDYSEEEIPGGHIGIYVSPRARAQLVRRVADWLESPG